MGYYQNVEIEREEAKPEVEAAIIAMKGAITKGDFVDIVLKEKLFIRYINLMYPCHESDTDVRTMRKGSFFWLRELYNAIRQRNAIAMKRAYNEFVRLYVMMEGTDSTKTKEEKTNEYVEHLTNCHEPGALSLTPDFFNELEFTKIDAEVTKYVSKNNKNEITHENTPEKNGFVENNNTNEITPEKIEIVENERNERGNDKKDGLKNKLNIDMNGWDSISVSNRLRNEITLEKNGNREKRRDQEGNNKTVSLKKRLNIDMNGWNEHSNHKLLTNKHKHI